MRYVLSNIEYANKQTIKTKKWNREEPKYELRVNNVLFENLNKEQYKLLYRIKGDE